MLAVLPVKKKELFISVNDVENILIAMLKLPDEVLFGVAEENTKAQFPKTWEALKLVEIKTKGTKLEPALSFVMVFNTIVRNLHGDSRKNVDNIGPK